MQPGKRNNFNIQQVKAIHIAFYIGMACLVSFGCLLLIGLSSHAINFWQQTFWVLAGLVLLLIMPVVLLILLAGRPGSERTQNIKSILLINLWLNALFLFAGVIVVLFFSKDDSLLVAAIPVILLVSTLNLLHQLLK